MQNNYDFSKVDQLLETELKAGTFPGAVLGIMNSKKMLYKKAFGLAQKVPADSKREMKLDTIFGLASLTKVIVTTSSIMKLIEMGKINSYDYLKDYFPELPEAKEEITIYHLLTHSSGFQAIVKLWDKDLDYQQKIKYILDLPLENEIGKVVNYSDPNFILLGELIQRVSGQDLNEFSQNQIFKPLNMQNTAYKPLVNLEGINKNKIAATEYCSFRDRMIVGEVHDENCYVLDEISGHAGLFSNLNDLSKFVKMLLNKGSYNGKKILTKLTVKTMIKNWTEDLNQNRALGWDLINNFRSSAGILLSDKAFGHTGFTGTSIWVDPELKLGVIFLTNRVHPSRDNVDIISLRPRLHNLIAAVLN
jgi:CubicO group peptidase (beta-lactamase class C family)